MVYTRRYGRRRGKKNYKKNYKGYRKYYPKPRKMLSIGFPKKMITKVRYVTHITLNPGAAGTAAHHIFKANGLFDPDITGVGHQPMTFDQYMAVYDNYTVIGSKIRATFINESDDYSYFVGGALKRETTTVANVEELIEQGQVKYRTVTEQPAGKPNNVITLNYSAKKFHKIKSLLNESMLRGDDGHNPTEGAYYHIWAADSSTDDPPIIKVLVQIDYIVAFINPKTDITQS